MFSCVEVPYEGRMGCKNRSIQKAKSRRVNVRRRMMYMEARKKEDDREPVYPIPEIGPI